MNLKDFFKENWMIFSIAIFFIVIYSLTLDSYGMFMWDEAEYATLGRAIINGEGYSISGEIEPYRLPFLPVLSGIFFLVSGIVTDMTAKLATLFMSIVGIVSIYFIIKKVFDKHAALLTSFLLGITPIFWKSTPHLLNNMPFSIIYFIAVSTFYLGINKNIKYLYLSWGFFGLALLTRYNAILFVPTIGIFFVLMLYLNKKMAISCFKDKHFWISPIAFVLVQFPWLIRQYIQFGNPFVGLMHSTQKLWGYGNIQMPWYKYFVYMPKMFTWFIVLLAICGIFYTFYKKNKFGLLSIISSFVIIFWFSQYGFKEERLIFGSVLFIVCLAGIGLRYVVYPILRKLINNTKITKISIWVFLFVLAGISYGSISPQMQTTVALGYPSFYNAMRDIKETQPEQIVLMGPNVPQMYWYSNRESVRFPKNFTDFKEQVDNVDLLVITNFERNQPEYVGILLQNITEKNVQQGDIRVYQNQGFSTVLMTSEFAQEQI